MCQGVREFQIFQDEELRKIIKSLMFLQKVLDIVFLELDVFCEKYRRAIMLQTRGGGGLQNLLPGGQNHYRRSGSSARSLSGGEAEVLLIN